MQKGAAVLAIILGSSLLVSAQRDPLRAEIERWSAFIHSDAAAGEIWAMVAKDSGPQLARAESALNAGRRLLALQRFAAARQQPEAAAYALAPARKDEQTDLEKFESVWKRAGTSMHLSRSFDEIHPAAIRALAEAAAPQVREYYTASLPYGRATSPLNGLLYLGIARAQKGFIDLARELSTPASKKPPALRSIAGDIDTLEGDLLAAYRPPASIDNHPQFIGASAAIKEARELDAAGLRYGALMRYLDAVRRFGQIAGSKISAEEATGRIRDIERQLSASGLDHTIAQLSIEAADDDPANLQAVAELVLPRYLAALQPAPASKARPAPGVTVTLVRWPYT